MSEAGDVTPPAPVTRAAVVVFLVAVAVYANTVANRFVVDDLHQIVDNEWITGIRHLPEIFSQGVWDFEGRASSYYRPLMYVLYMAAWYAVGVAPWGYHLLNVLLHAGASALVVAVAGRLWRQDPGQAPWWLSAPFVGGLLFAVHPVHTEAVAWVAGITDVSMTFFGLAAMWLYLRAEGRRLAMPLAAVSFLLAVLCKETGVVLPLLLIACEATLGQERWRMARVAMRLVPFAGALAVYLALRIHALGGLTPTARPLPESGAYAPILLALASGYVEKLVVPMDLNFWTVLAPPDSLLSVGALRAMGVLLVAGVVGWLAARSSRPAFFAVLVVVIPLLPAFHVGALNQGLENALAERYLYFPSVGLAWLAGLAAGWLRDRMSPRGLVAALAVGLVAGTFAVGTVRRNAVWRDSLTLWSDVVGKSPGSAVVRKAYGAALLYAGRREEGERELRAAVALRPDLVAEEIARGAAYASKGLTKKAILSFHTALALDPRSAPAHFALGVTYEAKGWTGAAIGAYRTALALRPDYAEAHNNLAILYAEQGLMEQALPHFEAAARLRPDEPDYRANLERARGVTRP